MFLSFSLVIASTFSLFFFFFFNDTATTEIYTLSLHDALPISELERTAARTDSLTSAPNRLALDEALVLEHGRIVRGARPAGLYIVDLDHFKRANDAHGHATGDA